MSADTANQTPTERLAELGFSLPPVEDEPEAPFPLTLKLGQRLIVGQLAPYKLEDVDIPRLNMDANIETIEEFETLADDHPLKLAVRGTRLATLRMLAHAARAGGGLDKVALCCRAQLCVQTGPNFARLGVVYAPVQRIMGAVFGAAPVSAVLGVAALPGHVPMMLDAEFILHA